jgi:uroporphyrinogen decarboxylase
MSDTNAERSLPGDSMMIPRERVWTAFHRKEPDALPVDLGGRSSSMAVPLYNDFKKRLGYGDIETKVLDHRANIADIDERILEKYKIDTRYVYAGPPDTWNFETTEAQDSTTVVDEWGATYRMPHGGFYFDLVDHPIKTSELASVDRYHWPDPDNKARYVGIKDKAKAYYDRGYIVGSFIKGVWETLWNLRGMENIMLDMYDNPQFYHAVAKRTAEVQAGIIKKLLAEANPFIQYVCVTCDLASQEGIMVSREFFRKFIKPYENTIFNAIRQGGAKVALHSCGAVMDMIPDLIDAGVEILNPIQTSAKGMDTQRMKKEFGNDLCFWGGVDVQQVLTTGTAEEVKRETRRVIEDLSPGGGYLFAPSHDIQVMTPLDNVTAMLDIVLELGNKA